MTETKPGGTGMREALEKLVFAARTSGGTAGRDEQLCSACDAAETALEIDRQIERAKREGNMAIGAVGGAALSSTGDERRGAIEECAKVAETYDYTEVGGIASGIATRIRSLLQADGGEKP